jgi:hypothetical protein
VVDRDLLDGDLSRLAIADGLLDGAGDDLFGQPALLLGGGRPLLTLQGELVLHVARDTVPLRDDLGGLDHRHVDRRLSLQHDRVARPVLVHVLVLDQADRLEASRDDDRHAVGDDLLRRHRHAHQARRALAVDGLARHGDGQPRGDDALASHVVARGALLERGPEDDVVDLLGIELCTGDGLADREGRQGRALGVVERTAIGFADRCPGGRNDGGFPHLVLPFTGLLQNRSRQG